MIIKEAPGVGRDAAGLARYLFGPGQSNEHTDQHIIGGSPELYMEWGDATLTSKEATIVGRILETSWRRQFAPELAMAGAGVGGISRANLTGGEDAQPGQGHVLHVIFSMREDETPLTDDQWREVSEKYLRGMGFIDNPEHPDVTWFTMTHGVSEKGNPHAHMAICTTRRDGSTIDLSNSRRRAQQVRTEIIEKLDYITPLHDLTRKEHRPGLKPYTQAEHKIAKKKAEQGGQLAPDRVLLQRIVRAAATQSKTEAEFINTVLSHPGVRIEATRWEPGSRDKVTGYKVGITGGVAFSASKLAPDLTLSKMRSKWIETPQSEQLARELWAGDATKLEPLTATRDVPAQLEQATKHLRDFNDYLSRLDPQEREAWSHATASIAGTAAVLATGRPTAFSEHGGRGADVLARIALEEAWGTPQTQPTVPAGASSAELATRHVQLALRAGSTDRHSGWLTVIQQLGRTVSAIAAAKQARGELAGAQRLNTDAAGAFGLLEQSLVTSVRVQPHFVPADPAAPAAGFERESERILREQRSTAAGSSSTVNEMTDDARAALATARHGNADVARPRPTSSQGDFPVPHTTVMGEQTQRYLHKPEALRMIAQLKDGVELDPGNAIAAWKGKDRDVDRALAQKAPKLFTPEERRALAQQGGLPAASTTQTSNNTPGEGRRL